MSGVAEKLSGYDSGRDKGYRRAVLHTPYDDRTFFSVYGGTGSDGREYRESMTNFQSIQKNDLMVADRAYGTLTGMRYLEEHGAYYVLRLKAKAFNLYRRNEKGQFTTNSLWLLPICRRKSQPGRFWNSTVCAGRLNWFSNASSPFRTMTNRKRKRTLRPERGSTANCSQPPFVNFTFNAALFPLRTRCRRTSPGSRYVGLRGCLRRVDVSAFGGFSR